MDEEHKTVALLSLDALNGATATMASAFFEDPLWRSVFPDEPKRRRALTAFFKAVLTLGITKRQTYGVGAQPVGVAVWNFPGQPQASPSLNAYARLVRLVLSPFAVAAFRARNIFAQFERMQKIYAPEPHYYLQSIGVRPGFQGQGPASGLMRPFLAEADARGISSYTETMTPSNVGLYEHFGFTCVEQYAVPGTQLSIWAFYRAAQR